MIYFDNAATGGFKPSAVVEDAYSIIKYLSANPGRSGHRLSVTGQERIYKCRKVLSEMYNSPDDRVVFTKNCTESLNIAIFGTIKKGGHVITTCYEHNSVLRPLFHLKDLGLISLDVVSPDSNGDIVGAISSKIKSNTYLIVTTAVSNVTGEVLPFEKIGALAKKHGLLYILDGAQAGGHLKINLNSGINALCLAGHKGLYGIMGSGVLIFDKNTEISPLIFGGTGSMSYSLSQPEVYPEKLEAGTLNLPAISALYEGVCLIRDNLDNFSRHLYAYTERTINALKLCPKVTCYSTPNPCGIVAFKIDDISSEQASDLLNSDYDVAVRGGLHCAPKMHEFLGTQNEGLIRASYAVQNTTREIDYFVKSIINICNAPFNK